MRQPKSIIISRTDKIGDVVLTLPMAGFLKERFPECRIIFLGRNYTRELVALSTNVDEFMSWDDVAGKDSAAKAEFLKMTRADTIIHVFPDKSVANAAAKAGIPHRIGTTGRFYHYLSCNEMVAFSRKKSDLHEAQLNFKLLKPLTGEITPTFDQLTNWYGFETDEVPPASMSALLNPKKFNLVLHPKSKGSAREWSLENYSELIRLLPEKDFQIFISGTSEEGKMMEPFLKTNQGMVIDLTGQFSLREFILFINQVDGLVAASTGPLHIASALGKLAVGIYPPIRPMHPGRWAPLGRRAHYLVVDKSCSDCRKNLDCHCMDEVKPEKVREMILQHAND